VIRQFRASLICLVCGIVILGFSRTTADPDLWGHLRFGLDLLDTGRVIRPDPYSFLTSGVTWVNHEWLAEAALAVAWRTAGALGIILLKLIVTSATVGVLYWSLLRRGLTVFGASTVLLVNVPLILPWLGAARPQMFTYLCFAITLAAIVEAETAYPLTPTLSPRAGRGSKEGEEAPPAPADEGGRRRPPGGLPSIPSPRVRSGERVRERGSRALWLLVPTFLFWANAHGGFLAGVGIVGLWIIARFIRTRSIRDVWLPLAVAILATLVTPYAGQLWLFLHTALTSRLEIVEWNPIEVISFEGLAHIVVLVPAVWGWFASRREKSPVLVFLFFVVVLLPFVARRHTPLFAMGLILLAGEHEADAFSALFERQAMAAGTRRAPDPRVMRVFAGMFVVTAIICVIASGRHYARIIVDREEYPIEAVQLLRASGVTGNVATNFNWGEYVLWHVGPGVKVSIDGRRETVYSEAVYAENQRFAFGYGKWDTLIERPGVDLALVPTQHWPVSNLLRLKPGWRPLYEDDRSAIFVRSGSQAEALLAKTPRPARAAAEVAFP